MFNTLKMIGFKFLHCEVQMFFLMHSKSHYKRVKFSLYIIQSKLGVELCPRMLFLFAFTSRIFHIGKSRFSKTPYRYHESSSNSTTRNMTPSGIYSPKIKTTLFIMGFTIPEIKNTCVPANAGNEIQSCIGMLNFYQLGSKFIKKQA